MGEPETKGCPHALSQTILPCVLALRNGGVLDKGERVMQIQLPTATLRRWECLTAPSGEAKIDFRLGVHHKDQAPDLANRQPSRRLSFYHVRGGMLHHQRLYVYNIEGGSRREILRSRRLHEREEKNKKANR